MKHGVVGTFSFFTSWLPYQSWSSQKGEKVHVFLSFFNLFAPRKRESPFGPLARTRERRSSSKRGEKA